MSYPLTREVFELFTKPYRQTAEITFNGVSESIKLTEKNLRQGGLTYTKSTVSGNKIEIGSAICAEVTLILDNRDGRFDGVKLEGAELYIRVGIKKWDAHRWEKAVMHYVPLGYFTVDESPRKLSEITLSALDRMAQFDKPVDFSALSFPMSLYELVSKACETCRVPLGTKSAEMLNFDYSVTAAPEQDGITWRQIIQRAAEISGTCAYIDRDGQLRFGWYKEPEGGYCPPITAADRFSSDLFENEITLTGVTVEDDENIYLAGAEGCTLDISENFLIRHDHAAVAKSIWDKLSGFSYTPFSAQIKSLPHYDPLDLLTFVDKNGKSHRVIVTDTGFTLNGAASLEGRGETETSGGYAALDPLTQRERDILSKMEKRQQRELSSREQAIIELNNTIWNSLGLRVTTDESPDGGKVYYYHDGETLADSTIIYTFRAGGFAWTNKWEGDGTVWQYGFTREGNAVVNALSAHKIQAEQIEAGSVTAEKLSMEYKSDLAKNIEDSVNTGMGTVRQEFKAADGELKSSISGEISETETRVTKGYGEAVEEEKQRALGAETGLSGEISGETERAKAAEQELTETVTQTETRLNSKIEQTAESVKIAAGAEIDEKVSAERSRAEGAEKQIASAQETHTEKLSELEVSVGGIRTTVSEQTETITEQGTRLEKAESSIEETANKIDAKVSKGDVCAQIKLETTEDGADVEIIGNHLTVDSDNFKLDKTGEVTAKGSFTSEQDRYAAELNAGALRFLKDGAVFVSLSAAGELAPTFDLKNGLRFYTQGRAVNEYVGVFFYPNGNVTITGSLMAVGGIVNAASTMNYGVRKLSAVESCLPVFSDMGSGTCDETGVGFVTLDPIFSETVELPYEYQVFITSTSAKTVGYVSEKTASYFIVKGEPGATFDWAVYIPQKGYTEARLEEHSEPEAQDVAEAALMEYVKSLAKKDGLLAASVI